MVVRVLILKQTATAKIPDNQSIYEAGYNVYADNTIPITIGPGETSEIPLNIKINFPEDVYVRTIRKPNSNYDIVTTNVDSNHNESVTVLIHNSNCMIRELISGYTQAQLNQIFIDKSVIINQGDYIGQIIINKRDEAIFDEVADEEGLRYK